MYLIRLLCLITVFSLLISCYTAPQAPLRVGTNQWAGYEPLYIARDMGLYDQKIRLKELTSATEVLRAFRQQQLEVAAFSLDEVLRLNQDIDDLRILLVTNISDGADRILVRPGIKSFTDLKGQRVAVEDYGVSAFMLSQSLAENKLSVADIKLVPATINQHRRIMQSGQADAVVTFDPVAHQLEKAGYNVLYDSSKLPIKILDVLVTRESVLTTRGDDIDRLIKGYWRGLDELKTHPERVYPAIASRLGLDISELTQIYAYLIMPDLADQQIFFQGKLGDSLQAQQQFMLTQGMLGQSTNTDHMLTNWNSWL